MSKKFFLVAVTLFACAAGAFAADILRLDLNYYCRGQLKLLTEKLPEGVTFGEYTTGRRVAGIVNALFCIFMKAGMALGGTIPGLVLAWVGFDSAARTQAPLAEQGILWLVTLIPALLFLLAIFVIGKYELSDKRMDEINAAITNR